MDPKELRGLVEAYSAVYDEELRQDLEEQQAFENWVNSLVEEGYDLSGYTLEEMYKEYLNEMGQTKTTGQATAKPVSTKPVMTAFSAGGGKAKVQKLMKTGMSGVEANRRVSATGEYLQKQAAKPKPQLKGLSIGKGGFQINGKPAAKPAPAAAKPAASGGTKPAALDSTSRVTPTKTVSQPPESKSQASAGEIRGMVGRSMERQATPTPAPKLSARAQALKAGGPQGGARERMLNQDVDLFDLIKGHLLDEGHAETEEQAIAIMANMSSEWRESIIDEALTGERYKKVMNKPGGTSYSRKVSADPSKRATRGGKGGESDFGAGDRGSGNKAARRAGTYED